MSHEEHELILTGRNSGKVFVSSSPFINEPLWRAQVNNSCLGLGLRSVSRFIEKFHANRYQKPRQFHLFFWCRSYLAPDLPVEAWFLSFNSQPERLDGIHFNHQDSTYIK